MVIVAWVFFRSGSLDYAFAYLKAMFGFGSGTGVQYYPALYLDAAVVFFMAAGLVGVFPVFPKLKQWYENAVKKVRFARLLNGGVTLVYTLYLTAVLLTGIMFLVNGTYNPFIYFRF